MENVLISAWTDTSLILTYKRVKKLKKSSSIALVLRVNMVVQIVNKIMNKLLMKKQKSLIAFINNQINKKVITYYY